MLNLFQAVGALLAAVVSLVCSVVLFIPAVILLGVFVIGIITVVALVWLVIQFIIAWL